MRRDFQKRCSSETPRTQSTKPRPETAPRTKLFRAKAFRLGEIEKRKLLSHSADHGANIRNRPISKQKRMNATARMRFMRILESQTPNPHCSLTIRHSEFASYNEPYCAVTALTSLILAAFPRNSRM